MLTLERWGTSIIVKRSINLTSLVLWSEPDKWQTSSFCLYKRVNSAGSAFSSRCFPLLFLLKLIYSLHFTMSRLYNAAVQFVIVLAATAMLTLLALIWISWMWLIKSYWERLSLSVAVFPVYMHCKTDRNSSAGAGSLVGHGVLQWWEGAGYTNAGQYHALCSSLLAQPQVSTSLFVWFRFSWTWNWIREKWQYNLKFR